MKKILLILVLLPTFAFAQNAGVSVMPGYSFSNKMQGPALSVQYSQAWGWSHSDALQWTWSVGLTSCGGAKSLPSNERFKDQLFGDMLSFGFGCRLPLSQRWMIEGDLFVGAMYLHYNQHGTAGYSSASMIICPVGVGADLKIGYRLGEHFGLGLFSSVMVNRSYVYGSPVVTSGLNFNWAL